MKTLRYEHPSVSIHPAAAYAVAIAIVLALAHATVPAEAQTYQILHTFTGGHDGANPMGTLVRDGAGNLYGTTYTGGHATGCGTGAGCGTVFRFTASSGKLKVRYTFTGGDDGGNPITGLVRDSSGNLYGTAGWGGQFFSGVAYVVPKTGGESVLHAFQGGPRVTSGLQSIVLVERRSACCGQSLLFSWFYGCSD